MFKNKVNDALEKLNLLDLDLEQLKRFFTEIGEKPFRALQLFKWIHQRRILDLNKMTDLSASLREKLQELTCLDLPEIHSKEKSKDGTCKWLLKIPGNNLIETVYIPGKGRGTLCISSQAGCILNCTFCSTGKQGFSRNLTTAEIIAQLWIAAGSHKITNVVMMGMGEPLLNYTNLLPALKMMVDDNGYGLSKRKVTVSTSGIVPEILRLAKDVDVALAISLHAPDDKLRSEIVPINKKYPIKQLIAACNEYLDLKPYKRHTITIEYVMLDGINDSDGHARALLKVLANLPSKINLIPFNPFPYTEYKRSTDDRINRFAEILQAEGFIVTIRRTRGDDVKGACGQLAGSIQDRTKRNSKWIKMSVEKEIVHEKVI